MSAFALENAWVPAAPRRSRLRLTRRGRVVLTLLLVAPVVLALVIAFFVGAGAAASSSAGASAGFEYVTVQPGQSMWELALELAPASDPRDVIADIQRLNALTTSEVHPGQRIAVPAGLH